MAIQKNKTKELPPLEFLNECFNYDPAEGILSWRERPVHHFGSVADCNRWNAQFAGTNAGYRCKPTRGMGRHNYLQVGITLPWNGFRSLIMVHRIIMALCGEKITSDVIVDHVDGDPWNNRRSNLRIATRSQNSMNCRPHNDRKTNLPSGVSKNKRGGGYIARISLGTFRTAELAYDAVLKAKKIFHGEFARF